MKVDSTHPPTAQAGRWERGLDPWHREAFPDEFKSSAPNQEQPRAGGWYELDGYGNVIGFVYDGTEV